MPSIARGEEPTMRSAPEQVVGSAGHLKLELRDGTPDS